MTYPARSVISLFAPSAATALTLVLGAPFASAQNAPVGASSLAARAEQAQVGDFEAHADIGITPGRGTAVYDRAAKIYSVTGGGNNMWARADAFHFAWKQMSGDVGFSADIAFLPNPDGPSDPHRKACLIVRESLDPDAAYVSAAVHGDGLTALQFRDVAGAPTREVMSNVVGPVHLRLEKRGDAFTLYVGKAGEEPKYSGASYNLKLREPFYVGLAVSAHNGNDTSTRVETATFANVQLENRVPPGPLRLYSTLETQASNAVNANQTQNTDRVVFYVTPGNIGGPVWLRDDSGMIFSRSGRLYRIPMRIPTREQLPDGRLGPSPTLGAATPLATGEPVPIDTGKCTAITHLHGLSPDGTQVLFVDRSQGAPVAGQQHPPANTYLVSVAGGEPKLLTTHTGAGSSLSPDGKTLVYDMDTMPNIFALPLDGSTPAKRLTNGGRNYGPQFTPDGNWILFCSDRSGSMQIWKMKPDGTEPTQLTRTEENNRFPRLSPNGAYAVFITYPKGVVDDSPHNSIEIRRLNLTSGANDQMGRLVGGAASAPAFSPASNQLTFVSYQWAH